MYDSFSMKPDEPQALGGRRWSLVLASTVAALYWCLLFAQLRVDWETNAQYNYGWCVPLLALGLFYRRWTLPVGTGDGARPGPALTRLDKRPRASRNWYHVVFFLLLVGLLPIRLIEEANAGWRRVLWCHSAQTVLVSFCALRYLGGWAWARRFAFPVVFALIAVPWPDAMEEAVVQGLMRSVAAVAVEIMTVLGIPALRQGNLVQISAGVVSVDEACSGIRSLQTSLMLGLFLGELYWLSIPRRLWLLGAGVGTAFIANVGRTAALTWGAARLGLERMNGWHDGAGLAAVLCVLAVVSGTALRLRVPCAPGGPAGPRLTGSDREPLRPVTASFTAAPLRVPPFGALASLVLWWLVVVAGTELWFRAHESNLIDAPKWTIDWPRASPGYRELKVPDRALAVLRCSESKSAIWQDAAGNDWNLIQLSWAASRSAATLVGGHRPDVCLRGAGWKLIKDVGLLTVNAGWASLPLRHYLFNHGGRVTHVFHCVWEDRLPKSGHGPVVEQCLGSRLRAVLEGRRQTSRMVLEIALVGPAAPEEAARALEQQLVQIVRSR
jgi:exosortase